MVFGVDPHKQSHTAAAADELGRRQAHKTVKARQEGCRELIAWARDLAPDGRRWAVEDVRHVASGLVRELLAAGEEVVFVPTRLMAGTRSGGRERGKSDPIDALANARAALREDVFLPAARLNGQVLDVRRLADHRDDLVAQRTAMINRLRWLVHDLDPALAPAPRTLSRTRKARRQLEAGLRALPAGAGRRIALSLLAAVTALTEEIASLEEDLSALVTRLCPELLTICGISVITAAASSARPATSAASAARPPTPGTTAPPPSPPPAAPATSTASTAAATGRSTPPSTAPPSPRPAATTALKPSWNAAPRPSARPAKQPSASSSATCPTSSTAPCSPTPGASTSPTSKPLDIGASWRRCWDWLCVKSEMSRL